MYSLFLTTLFCWPFSVNAETIHEAPRGTQHVTVADIGMPKVIEAKVDAGSIIIHGANSGFSCNYTAHNTDPSKTVKVVNNNGVLEVAFKKEKGNQGWSLWTKKKIEEEATIPKVDFHLTVPKNCAITLNIGGGLVQLTSLDGKIEVSSGSARVKGNALTGKVHVNVGSGSIELYELQGDVHVNSGSSKIDLAYADVKKDAPRKCTVKGGSANAVIKLPSSWCVKNKLRASIVSKVSNAFGDCAKKQKPDMVVYGGIGTGTIKIVKK